jgi:hypothetical protein
MPQERICCATVEVRGRVVEGRGASLAEAIGNLVLEHRHEIQVCDCTESRPVPLPLGRPVRVDLPPAPMTIGDAACNVFVATWFLAFVFVLLALAGDPSLQRAMLRGLAGCLVVNLAAALTAFLHGVAQTRKGRQ